MAKWTIIESYHANYIMLLWQIVKCPHENQQEQMWAIIGIYCKCELKWGWTCFGQGRFRNANSIICWLLWTICLQWLITHVIVGYNIGAMKQVWLLYLWLQVTSITMNIVGCKDDITHHMTNSTYFFEMEAPHGLLEERLMF